MEAKVEIIEIMIRNGYHLMDRTAEELANIFTLEELEDMAKRYIAWKPGK